MRDHKALKKFETEEQLREEASKPYFSRVQIINWDGPGWYYIFRYSQPCPRGCCYDSVFEAVHASKQAKELASEIKDLASELKRARELGEEK